MRASLARKGGRGKERAGLDPKRYGRTEARTGWVGLEANLNSDIAPVIVLGVSGFDDDFGRRHPLNAMVKHRVAAQAMIRYWRDGSQHLR